MRIFPWYTSYTICTGRDKILSLKSQNFRNDLEIKEKEHSGSNGNKVDFWVIFVWISVLPLICYMAFGKTFYCFTILPCLVGMLSRVWLCETISSVYTNGIFHAKMGIIKDRNGLDLTEAEDIKKSWQEYTEKLYIKDLNDPHNHNGVITHLEPDRLEYEVKWALGSITNKASRTKLVNKASGGDGIPVELVQILKDDAVKVLHSIC